MKKLLGLVIVGASAAAMASTVTACNNKSTQETAAIKLLNAMMGKGDKADCAVLESDSKKADCEKSYDDYKAAWTSFSLNVEKSQTNVNTVDGIEYTIATVQYKMTGKATVGEQTIELEASSILHFMFNAQNKIAKTEATYANTVKPAESTTGSLDTYDKYKK